MATLVTQLHRRIRADFAYCFNVAYTRPMTAAEMERLRLILADGFLLHTVTFEPQLRGERVVEVGPRLNFATAWSSNLVSICRAVGLDCVTRVERSRRYLVPEGEDLDGFIARHHDRMTECPYPAPLTTFETGIIPEPVYEVDLLTKGPDGLLDIPGTSMDEWDRELYYDYFVKRCGRNPTIVEIMDLNNANSEHSRHGFFRGRQVIDGKVYDRTLFQVVTDTLAANPKGSLVAFKDNSSVIRGTELTTLLPAEPGAPSPLTERTVTYHPLLTAETHNFPTGVAPFPGAETGTGGRIRDVQGTGRGGLVMAGTAGYCVANLHIPGLPAGVGEPLRLPGHAGAGAGDRDRGEQRRLGLRQQVRRAAHPGLHPQLRPAPRVRRALGLPEADHVHRRHRPDRRPPHRKERGGEGHAHRPGGRPGLPGRLRRRRGLVHAPG